MYALNVLHMAPLLDALVCTLKRLESVIESKTEPVRESPLADFVVSLALGKLTTVRNLIHALSFERDHIYSFAALHFNEQNRCLHGSGKRGGRGEWVYYTVYYWLSGPPGQTGYELLFDNVHDVYSHDENVIMRRLRAFFA